MLNAKYKRIPRTEKYKTKKDKDYEHLYPFCEPSVGN
jgi:hypothetical protein